MPNNLIDDIKEQIKNTIFEIKKILIGRSAGISIREGFLVAILGKPNAGKSSFINTVSGRDVAIVTNQPGTTRDLIESFIDVLGYPIKFVDTAGIRTSPDLVEKIGVERAISTSKDSDINLVFIDKEDDMLDFKDIKTPFFIRSKQDLNGGAFKGRAFFNISSKNNYGIDSLLKEIIIKIKEKIPNENISISRERHSKCLLSTIQHLESSQKEKKIDIFAEDIRISVKCMSSLFGGVDIEDILDIIFSDFCIGK